MGATATMTGYIQWAPWWRFKPGDVVLNAGFFWILDDDGDWRIIDALPGQPPASKGPHPGEVIPGRGP